MSKQTCHNKERGTALVTENHLDRRTLLKTTASGAATLSVSGCLSDTGSIIGNADSPDPITIGLLAPNPENSYIGRGMKRGATIAIDEINNSGGLLGRDVKLAIGDTNSSPLEARRQYQRLILEEKADVTVGVFDSPSIETIIEDIAEQQTLHLTANAGTAKVSEKIRENYDKYKYHFRVGTINNFDVGRSLIDFLDGSASKIGWDSVAILAENYSWTHGPWTILQDQIDDVGIDIRMKKRYPPATRDFTDLYSKVRKSNADAAFVLMAHTGDAALQHWSTEQQPFAFGGLHVPMQLPSYYEATNGSCKYGVSMIGATAKNKIGEYTQSVTNTYESRYGSTPTYPGATYATYDAINVYNTVVKETGTHSTAKLIPQLENGTFPGATGTISFYGPDHQYPHDLVYEPEENTFFQWQENNDGEGVQEIIWPEKHRTSTYEKPSWLQ